MQCEGECKRDVTRATFDRETNKWLCTECLGFEPASTVPFYFKETVNFKYYYKNRGNVSKARVNHIKSRCISRDDFQTPVMRDKTGRITDRRASDHY